MKCPLCETHHANDVECPDLTKINVQITAYKKYLNFGPYMNIILKRIVGKYGTIIGGPVEDAYHIEVDGMTIWVPDCMLKFL